MRLEVGNPVTGENLLAIVTYLLSINERVSNGDEVAVKHFKTSKQAPDHNDESGEIIIIVEKNLGVIATDTNTNCLRTEEDHRSSSGHSVGDCWSRQR